MGIEQHLMRLQQIGADQKGAAMRELDMSDLQLDPLAPSVGLPSLIETCKINGVEPFAYLKATLEAIAAGYPKNRIDDLLPWNFMPSS